MMARVPTWTELRLDAENLIQLQKECIESVNQLLNSAIPELDRKIFSLSEKQDLQQPSYKIPNSLSMPSFPQASAIKRVVSPKNDAKRNNAIISVATRNIATSNVATSNVAIRNVASKNVTSRNVTTKSVATRNVATRNVATNFPTPTCKTFSQPSLDELEHLRPPPLPLSEYLRRRRPDIVKRADLRAIYLRKKSERRKYLLSSRIINSLERIRLSSRSSHNYPFNKQKQKSPQQSYSDHMAPTYQVRCKLSEHEMKRLTAKTYKRLPEVKRRRKEEVTNHMKVQNYKNRLEYGRKLLENRRNGIIDYPLRSSYDDRSITSSQSDFSINGYVRATDVEFG